MHTTAMTAAPHIPNFSIKGFRGLKDLSLPELGRVNLITGKNNTGKSSVLEALRIFTQNAAPSTIYNILQYREEVTRRGREEERTDDPDDLFQISYLFHGFPRLSEEPEPIEFFVGSKTSPMFLNMSIDWLTMEHGPEGNRLARSNQKSFFAEAEAIASLVAKTEQGEKFYRLENFLRNSRLPSVRHPGQPNDIRLPCVPVSPHGVGGTETLGKLWDGIVLTDIEPEVVEALRIVDPQISAVSMIDDEGPVRTNRRAIVRTSNIGRPVPLRSFGDGLNRLFVIILSLANAGGGLLLVDEFENSLHHTVQLDAWRIIFRLAKELDIQVFATTHSNDAVKAFQEAAAETPEDGMLVRLTRRGGEIIHTTLEESELAIATRDRIEVR